MENYIDRIIKRVDLPIDKKIDILKDELNSILDMKYPCNHSSRALIRVQEKLTILECNK